MPLKNVQKERWWAISSFTCTLLFLGKENVTEVVNLKLVCLGNPVMEKALAALNNPRGDKIKISNE